MPWTRASSLTRSLKCVASTVLPTHDERSQLSRDAADWGTLAHHWAFTGEVLDSPWSRLLEKHIDVCGINREALWPAEGCIPPTAFAIDCESGRIQTNVSPFPELRNAWKLGTAPRFFTGEWDYAQVIGPTGWVDDLKTGRPPEPDDDQIASYCLALWLDYDRGLNVVRRSVTHWPRPNLYAKNPRAFHPPQRIFGPDMSHVDLTDLLLRLQAGYGCHVTLSELDAPEDYANPGDHCQFCQCRLFCPAGN